MTTPLVQSISDDQLADSERLITELERLDCALPSVRAMIARLRAAEADAKRYRHLLDNAVSKHIGQHTPVLVCSFDLPLNDWRNEVSRRIDAAMERTP